MIELHSMQPKIGSIEMIEWLIKNGIRISVDTISAAISDPKLMKWLIEHGAQWNEQALIKAAQHNQLDIMKWLLEHLNCYHSNVGIKDILCTKCYAVACVYSNVDILNFIYQNDFRHRLEKIFNVCIYKTIKYNRSNAFDWLMNRKPSNISLPQKICPKLYYLHKSKCLIDNSEMLFFETNYVLYDRYFEFIIEASKPKKLHVIYVKILIFSNA